ncbi:MAG: hypothetical protein ABJA87_05670 [bacterium]
MVSAVNRLPSSPAAMASVVAVLLVAACTSATGTDTAGSRFAADSSASSSPSSTASASTGGATSSDSTSNGAAGSSPPSSSGSTTSSSTPASPSSTAPAPPPAPQLPLGGRTLLPKYRVVAYYGVPHSPGLGVLGTTPPDEAAREIKRVAAGYAGYGRKVQPAMEVVATVAQGSAGPDGLYSDAIPDADIAEYLKVAKANRMLLVLDVQPGRGEFLPQVRRLEKYLLDPWVGVALDPEWKISPGELPGREIGHSRAESINAVSSYLSALVTEHHLPQKLFVVHQFTLAMLPDRQNITRHPQLALVFHADGHGGVGVKQEVYGQLHFPRSAGAGFKLFYREDPRLMSPAEVMALRRRPDLITYQ